MGFLCRAISRGGRGRGATAPAPGRSRRTSAPRPRPPPAQQGAARPRHPPARQGAGHGSAGGRSQGSGARWRYCSATVIIVIVTISNENNTSPCLYNSVRSFHLPVVATLCALLLLIRLWVCSGNRKSYKHLQLTSISHAPEHGGDGAVEAAAAEVVRLLHSVHREVHPEEGIDIV